MRTSNVGQCTGKQAWWVALLLVFVVACNVDDDQVTRPGQGNDNGDVGDLDVGQPDTDPRPDTGEPDTGEPDADVAAPSCDDGVQNGNETGEDCGGDCAPCALGVGCDEAADCASGFCTESVCVDESCVDVECGEEESCYRSACYLTCEDADGCNPSSRCFQGACLPLDCSSTECAENETCYRGVCYGACSGDESCSEEGAECVEGSCVVATCEDGLQNGDETDIDCGGSECDACAAGKMCELGEDCQEPLATPWSDCDFGADTCAQVGTQSRTVTTYSCGDAMTCEVSEEIETQECTRQTDDQECGETVIGDWGDCQGAGEQGVCTTEGERRRVITSYVCADGGCDVVTDEEFESCVLDTSEQACGAPETGAWSACGGFENTCDQDGTRSRTVTYFECDGADCNERTDTETEICNRSTAGQSCGETTYADWSACEGFSGVCGQSGTRNRTVTYRECSGGSCSTRTATESETCTRNTNGNECQGDVIGNWSSCNYADATCSTSGSRTRTVTEYACQGGSCATSSRTETDTAGCARTTNGTTCGTTTYANWGSCGGFSDVCDTTGTQSRTATDRKCSNGTCSTTTRTENQSCTRSVANGTSCGTTTYSSWGSCGGFSDTCDTSGTQSRTATDRVCSNGSCTNSTRTENQSCTRATNGTSCGTTSSTSWSTCGGFSDVCDTTGSQSRETTTRTCSGGNCQSTTSTETQSCTRSVANGTTCGATTYTSYGSCGGFSDVCDTSGTQSRTATDRKCSNGTCSTSTRTESQGCTRSVANGTTCGATTYSSWGSCGGFANTCDTTGTQSRTATDRKCSNGTCSTSTRTENQGCTRSVLNGTSCGSTTYGNWGPCLVISGTCGGDERRSVTQRRCSNGSCNDVVTFESRSCQAPAGSGCTCSSRFGTCTSSGFCDCRLQELCQEGMQCSDNGTPGCCIGGTCRGGFACP